MPISKPWLEASEENLRRAPGALGVYEIGDAEGRTLLIGFAGGRSRYGLRGEIERRLSEFPACHSYRYEVNMMYLTRYVELLERHLQNEPELPPGNQRPGEYLPTLRQPARPAMHRPEQGG